VRIGQEIRAIGLRQLLILFSFFIASSILQLVYGFMNLVRVFLEFRLSSRRVGVFLASQLFSGAILGYVFYCLGFSSFGLFFFMGYISIVKYLIGGREGLVGEKGYWQGRMGEPAFLVLFASRAVSMHPSTSISISSGLRIICYFLDSIGGLQSTLHT
jgi:hypothetical protein